MDWFLHCNEFVVSPGQMRVIVVVTVEGAEVSFHTLGQFVRVY